MTNLLSRTRDMYHRRGPLGTAFGIAKFLTPHPYDAWVEIARVERKKALSVPLSLPTRLALYRRGFESHTYRLYGFENGTDPDDYLSEFARKGYTGRINGEMSSVLDDKRKFHAFMSERGLGEHLPDLFGVLEGDNFISETYHSLSEVFDEHAKIVIKNTGGSAGEGVYICEREAESLLVNGERWTRDELAAELHGPTDYLVTEFCEQAAYLEDIYPHATNTLRVLMMNPDNEEPFIAIAVQRLGTRHSGSLDNFSQGGLSVEVDTDTGEFGPAAEYSPAGPNWHRSHPDTGARIDGVHVPQWDTIKDRLLEIATTIPELPYVAWDVLVTESGEFVLIEGNNRSDMDLLQVHRPLLVDDRVRRFYRNHGVPV